MSWWQFFRSPSAASQLPTANPLLLLLLPMPAVLILQDDKDTEGGTAAVEAAVRQALTGNPAAGANGVTVRVEGSGN